MAAAHKIKIYLIKVSPLIGAGLALIIRNFWPTLNAGTSDVWVRYAKLVVKWEAVVERWWWWS